MTTGLMLLSLVTKELPSELLAELLLLKPHLSYRVIGTNDEAFVRGGVYDDWWVWSGNRGLSLGSVA